MNEEELKNELKSMKLDFITIEAILHLIEKNFISKSQLSKRIDDVPFYVMVELRSKIKDDNSPGFKDTKQFLKQKLLKE